MADKGPFRHFDLSAWPVATMLLIAPIHGVVHGASLSDKDTWRAECGSCHVAYPSKMLAAGDWSRVLAALDRHYGVDASLGAGDLATVSRYLGVTQGSPVAGGVTALPRITTSAWFREEHAEVSARTWQRPGVKSAANCSACHPGAEQGRFDEDSIHIPK